jgi:ABC-type glycerol-3-phosphate transport system substrate-binding protein
MTVSTMKKYLKCIAAMAVAAALSAGCSGGTNSSSDVPVTSTDAVPPSTAAPDHYDTYVQLAAQLNAGHVISKMTPPPGPR